MIDVLGMYVFLRAGSTALAARGNDGGAGTASGITRGDPSNVVRGVGT